MHSILLLPPFLRLLTFFFSLAIELVLMLAALFSLFTRRKALQTVYLGSLFVAVFSSLLTRTPLVYGIPSAVGDGLSLLYLLPAALALYVTIREKKILFFFDCLWCVVNVSYLSFVPYYAYGVSFLLGYMVVRAVLFSYLVVELGRNAPGRLSIKYALDNMDDGIAFVNVFGQFSYVNDSFKSTLSKIGLTPYHKAADVKKAVAAYAKREGRAVSEDEFILQIEDRSFLFSFAPSIGQIYCMDVTEEEKLTKESERNRLLLEKANEELTEALKNVENVQKEKELLALKGYVHDNLAQQLSILHSFILRDESTDLIELKQLLNTLTITPDAPPAHDGVEEERQLLSSIGVKLIVVGEPIREEKLLPYVNKFVKETCTNALRHGKAREITLTFSETEDSIAMSEENNGRVEKPISFGNGLHSLSRDAEELGGKLTVDANDKFSLTVTFPKNKG